MKILYAYREYYDRWENKGVGTMLQKYGHKVHFVKLRNKKDPNQIKLKHVKGGFNAIWLLYAQLINVMASDAYDYVKSKKIPIIVYAPIITNKPYTEQLDLWKKIDVYFAQSTFHAEFMKDNGLNAHFVPIGFAPEEYKKAIRNRKYDVTFMGSCQSSVSPEKDRRVKFLKAIKNVKVFGKTFRGRLDNVTDYTTRNEQINVYSKSKINLDLPWINSSLDLYRKRYHIKNRFFEIPATCNFMLTLRDPEFTNILDETMVGYYDDNVESFKEQVARYLIDEDIRKKMAKRAYKEVHARHTFDHRIKKMLRILGW